jgi:hypothetical protein
MDSIGVREGDKGQPLCTQLAFKSNICLKHQRILQCVDRWHMIVPRKWLFCYTKAQCIAQLLQRLHSQWPCQKHTWWKILPPLSTGRSGGGNPTLCQSDKWQISKLSSKFSVSFLDNEGSNIVPIPMISMYLCITFHSTYCFTLLVLFVGSTGQGVWWWCFL